jgi:cutinase
MSKQCHIEDVPVGNSVLRISSLYDESLANDILSPDTAGLMDNVSATGTTQSAINEAIKHYTTASTKCPQTVIVTGGFSQGTAVILGALSKLDAGVKSKVVGAVLYGYTKNKQTGGTIKGYPQDRLKVFCPAADGVCGGMLNVNLGHFAYLMDGTIAQGANFLISKIG